MVTHEKMSGSTNFTMLFQVKDGPACVVLNIKTACSQAKRHLICEIPQGTGFLVFKTSHISVSKSESIFDIYLIYFALKMHNVNVWKP